jgi:hypothetical protein
VSSLVTQMIIAERYGLRLGIEQLADVLKLAAGTVRNQIQAETFPVHTYLDGGKRWADYRHVADHFDRCAAKAAGDSAGPHRTGSSGARR